MGHGVSGFVGRVWASPFDEDNPPVNVFGRFWKSWTNIRPSFYAFFSLTDIPSSSQQLAGWECIGPAEFRTPVCLKSGPLSLSPESPEARPITLTFGKIFSTPFLFSSESAFSMREKLANSTVRELTEKFGFGFGCCCLLVAATCGTTIDDSHLFFP